MEAGLGGTVHAADDVSLFIGHDHHHRRLDLAVLGAQLFQRRIRLLHVPRLVALVFFDLRLRLLTLLAAALQFVLQVIGEDGAERRVRRGEVGLTLKGLTRQPELCPLDIELRVACRKERGLVAG